MVRFTCPASIINCDLWPGPFRERIASLEAEVMRTQADSRTYKMEMEKKTQDHWVTIVLS